MSGLLDGQAVLVTGSSRGVGAAIARVLGAHGARVAVNYRERRDAAERVCATIAATGGTARPFAADVTQRADCERLVAEAEAAFGRLDGLVNSAISGVQDAPFDAVDDDDFRTAFAYGCVAVVDTIRAARPAMKRAGGGRIVNVVTEIWNMAPAGWSVYLAGKGAMVGVSRSLAMELGPEGITVNMVAPGWMVHDDDPPDPGESAEFAAELPLRHHGRAEEIGEACAFLLSDMARYVTGAYLPVTGGRITQLGG